MNYIASFLLFIIPCVLFGQNVIKTITSQTRLWAPADTTPYDLISTYYYNDSTQKATVKTITVSGQITSIMEYADTTFNVLDGTFKEYYINGQIRSIQYLSDGKIIGERKDYYPSGQLKRKELYENGEWISGSSYTKSGKDTTFFDKKGRMAQYPGGQSELVKFISENVEYPKEARKKRIEGKVVIDFTIDKDGTVKNAYIHTSVDPLLDAEALRVVRLMKRWTPAYHDGENFPQRYRLPITFVRK